MAEQSGANYFTPLVGPEGFVGSEVQPRCSAEDCIWLNCAVVFNTIVNGGILEKAGGPRCEQFLLSRPDCRRQEYKIISDDLSKKTFHFCRKLNCVCVCVCVCGSN